MAGADKRAQIADALAGMGFSRGVARESAEKLDDLSRPLADLLRDGLRYATGESPKTDKGIKVKESKSPDLRAKAPAERGVLDRVRAGLRKTFSGWTPEQKKLGMVAAGGVVAGGVIAILAGRAGRSPAPEPKPDPTTLKGAPPPPVPSASAAHEGTSLIVDTTKGPKGSLPGRLRASAGLSGAPIGTVPAGETVRVLGSALADKPARRWYRVQTLDGRTGWMHSEILSEKGSTS